MNPPTPPPTDPKDSFSTSSAEKDEKEIPPRTSLMDKFKGLADKHTLEHFSDYARGHPREMVAYALLSLGLILLFIFPMLGQALVGIVIAIYFAPEIWGVIENYDPYSQRLGSTRSLVLVGAVVAFFIQAPMIFVAIIATVTIRHFLLAEQQR